MPSDSEWNVPPAQQPRPEDYAYDLDRALSAVVGLRAMVPEDAFTAGILGTERAGNGVVIDKNGLVLTIGYLVTEAETIWLSLIDGRVVIVPGHRHSQPLRDAECITMMTEFVRTHAGTDT